MVFTAGWVESTTNEWPVWAETLLRKQMIEFSLVQYSPRDPGYTRRLQCFGQKLQPYINSAGGGDIRHGQLFWQKVNIKITAIRLEAARNAKPPQQDQISNCQNPRSPTGHLIKNLQDRSGHSTPPPAKVWNMTSQTETATAQRSIPNSHDQAICIWNSADSHTQLNIFRSQLRSVKDPKALMHEMAKLCAKVYGKSVSVLSEPTKKIYVEPPSAFAIPWDNPPEEIPASLTSFDSCAIPISKTAPYHELPMQPPSWQRSGSQKPSKPRIEEECPSQGEPLNKVSCCLPPQGTSESRSLDSIVITDNENTLPARRPLQDLKSMIEERRRQAQ